LIFPPKYRKNLGILTFALMGRYLQLWIMTTGILDCGRALVGLPCLDTTHFFVESPHTRLLRLTTPFSYHHLSDKPLRQVTPLLLPTGHQGLLQSAPMGLVRVIRPCSRPNPVLLLLPRFTRPSFVSYAKARRRRRTVLWSSQHCAHRPRFSGR
jgi:hypothetical protein